MDQKNFCLIFRIFAQNFFCLKTGLEGPPKGKKEHVNLPIDTKVCCLKDNLCLCEQFWRHQKNFGIFTKNFLVGFKLLITN